MASERVPEWEYKAVLMNNGLPLPYELRRRLMRINELVGRTGGVLRSRQEIAGIMEAYEREVADGE